MQNNNLIKLLKTFTPDEFRKFILFVNSPFFNREKVLIKFSVILKKHYPDLESDTLNKKAVFSKLFPGRKYNDALIRNTVSDFLKLAEEYLKMIQLKKDPFNEQYLLLKELTNRKQQKLFNANFKKATKILKETGIIDEMYYQNKFYLEDELRRNVVVSSSRILFKDDNLDQQAFNHNLHFLLENIKLYAILLNQSKFTFDHKFDFTLFELLRKYIEDNLELYKDIPYINIFYNCVMIFKTGEKKYFDELKSLVKKHYFKLSLTDRKNMFIVLTNYCNAMVKKGKFEFYNELHQINLELLKTKAYLEGNDFMAHYIYNTVALTAVFNDKTEWAENFVNKYKSILHPDFRESSYNYCLANIYLGKGKYDESLEILSKVEPLDIIFKLNINKTLLKIYFCKNESESFFSLVDSFRHFLKRNKVVRNDDRITYSNFISYLRKLFQLKSNHGTTDRSEISVLKKKLENENEIAFKKWLLDKINEALNES